MSGFRDNRLLKISYLIGGIYDSILGLVLIFFSDPIISFFEVSKPNHMLFVHTCGIFLLAIGYFLLFAAFHETGQYIFIGFGSAFVRLFFAIIALFLWLEGSIENIYLIFAFTDSLTGIFLLYAILKERSLTIRIIWE